MRFSVPQLSHTFLRLVLFIVVVGALLTPFANIFAQSPRIPETPSFTPTIPSPTPYIIPGSLLDSYGMTPNPTGPIDLSLPNGTPLTSVTINDDGSVTGTNPETGESVTVPPNPDAGLSASEISAVADEQRAISIEEEHGLLVSIGGWIAGLGGNLFELAYTNFALKMGCYFVANTGNCAEEGLLVDSGQVGGVVNVLWEVIRDLVNIAIIFSLIYIGFMLIINGDDSGTKKALGSIIIAALLINFSLYIAKVVVDLSNFATVAIYSAMETGGNSNFGAGGDGPGAVEVSSQTNGSNLASHFMTILRITSMYDVSGEISNPIMFAIMAMFFLIFLGAIFLYGAIMLMARFIAIIVLLIFSPVMVLGLVLPNFKSISADWRKKFVGYCLFAPAFTFMIYISLYTLIQMAPGGGSYGDAFNGEGAAAVSAMPMFLFFAVGAGLLFMSTKVAGTIASGSGSFLTKTADGFARKLSLGVAAGAAGMTGGYLGRGVVGGLGGNALKNASEAIERRTGRSFAATRGLRSAGENLQKRKFGGSYSYKDKKDAVDGGNARASRSREIYGIEQAIKVGTATDASGRRTATTEQIIEMERKVKGASSAQIIEMVKNDSNTIAAIAGELSDDQVKAIAGDKDIDDTTKNKVLGKRQEQIETRLKANAGVGDIKEAISKADTSELKALGFKVAYDNAEMLNAKQIEDWKDLTTTEKNRLKGERKRKIELEFSQAGGPGTIFARFKTDAERAKLPTSILTSGAATLYLNTNTLTKILDNDGITDTERSEIRSKIMMRFPAGTPEGDKWQKWFDTNNAGQRY